MDMQRLESLLQISDPAQLVTAIDDYQLNIDMISALKDHSAQFYASQPGQAVRVAELAHRLSQAMPMPAPALGQWTLANALVFTAHYSEAAHFFAQAYAAYRAIDDQRNAARLSVGYVITLAFTGKMEEALTLAAASEPILTTAAADDPADLRRLGNLLMNVGLIHEVLGRYEEALAITERQTQIAARLDDRFMLAQLKHNQACVLTQLNAWDAALDAFQSAAALFSELGDQTDLGRLYTNQAILLSNMQRYTAADEALRQAERLIADLPGVEQQLHWLALQRAMLAVQSQAPIEQALVDRLAAAVNAFAHHGNRTVEGLANLIMGQCLIRSGAWAQAAHAFAQVQQLVRQGADRSLEGWALHGLALLAAAQDHFAAAVHTFEAALTQIENLRRGLNVELFRAAFLADKLIIYQDFARVQIAAGNFDDAFHVVERAKARLLTEKLTFQLYTRPTWADGAQTERVRALTNQLSAALQQVDTLYRQARFEEIQQIHELPLTTATPIVQQITTAEQTVEQLLGQLQQQQPLLANMLPGGAVTLPQLLPYLDNAILLQYHVLHDVVALFIVDHSGIRQHLTLAPLADVESARQALALAIERMLELVRQHGVERAKRYIPVLLADTQKHLQLLYALLFQPIHALLPTDAPLIVALDGTLHYVPFHALYDGQRYLLEERVISYTPSATVLSLSLQHPVQTTGVALVGYDDQTLQAVSHEIATLQHIFPTATQWLADQATTARFVAEAATYRILHLATHAQFRTDHPLLSAIALADRQLTLADIMLLQLDADLVVLSGCETGYGKLMGTDLFSLAGGFLGVGARALLVSLWRVEDVVTASLMQHFYQALLAGESRSAALRSAQLAILQIGRQPLSPQALYAHPAFWAPFTLLGDWRPLSDLTA